jgi:hemin uptake protein HemP
MEQQEQPALPAKDAQQNSAMPKIVQFEDLVICGDEVWIQFKGQLYRLRRTKHDKLILTK